MFHVQIWHLLWYSVDDFHQIKENSLLFTVYKMFLSWMNVNFTKCFFYIKMIFFTKKNFFFFFGLCCAACGILIPQPGTETEPGSPQETTKS